MDIIDRIRALLKLPLLVYTVLRTLYDDYTRLLARACAPPGLPVPHPTSAFWQDDPPHPDLVAVRSPAGPPRAADVVVIGSGITGLAIARSVLRELDRKGALSAAADGGGGGGGGDDVDDDDDDGNGNGKGKGGRKDHVRVLVLEARELCSGATGRNGGHIKASPHELYHLLTRSNAVAMKMTPRRAAALCAFQISHVRALGEVARAEGVEAVSEFRPVQTVDFAVDDETCAKMNAMRDEFVAAWRGRDRDDDLFPGEGKEGKEGEEGEEEYEMRAHSGPEARRLFGVNERVVGAIEYPAGALWPYRFVTALWDKLLRRYQNQAALAIETGTAVEAVEVVSNNNNNDNDNENMPYVVSTTRGQVRARHVVHATNGFASHLVPGLAGKATGVACHMTAQRPGANVPKTDGRRSYSVIYGSGFDYITQRPPISSSSGRSKNGGEEEEEGGELMIGGGLFQSGKQGTDMVGVYDDSKLDALTLMHLEGSLSTIFGWGAEAPGGKGRMIKAWSGIIGLTGDMLPLVGRLDPRLTKRGAVAAAVKKNPTPTTNTTPTTTRDNTKMTNNSKKSEKEAMKAAAAALVEPGEWIAAYFCGDGMVWAWLCGTALGIMLTGGEHEDRPREPGTPGGRLADWFPPELRASWGRVQKMDIGDLADQL